MCNQRARLQAQEQTGLYMRSYVSLALVRTSRRLSPCRRRAEWLRGHENACRGTSCTDEAGVREASGCKTAWHDACRGNNSYTEQEPRCVDP